MTKELCTLAFIVSAAATLATLVYQVWTAVAGELSAVLAQLP